MVGFEALLARLRAKLTALKEATGSLSIKDDLILSRSTELLPKLIEKHSTRQYWQERLKFVVGARLLKPQSHLNLPLSEEMHRVFETWKGRAFK